MAGVLAMVLGDGSVQVRAGTGPEVGGGAGPGGRGYGV